MINFSGGDVYDFSEKEIPADPFPGQSVSHSMCLPDVGAVSYDIVRQ